MKYCAGFLLVFCYCQSIWAQTIPPLQRESDDYSTYLIPNLETGLILLEADIERFQELMKQFQYQEFHRGFELEFLAPSSRINQLRLIRKEKNQVQFIFSPTKLHLIQQLEQALIARKAIVSRDQGGMTWYKLPPLQVKSSNVIRVGIKLESDSEDRVGRTWAIWSTTVIFSKN